MYDSPEVQRHNEFRSSPAATGLSAGKARYYNPTMGRFISEDPRDTDPFFRGLNHYFYVGNMPIRAVDPTGMDLTVDDSCRCKYLNNGPGGPAPGGGGPELSSLMQKEVGSQCLLIASQIADPLIRLCVMLKCTTGKVACKDCDDKDKVAGGVVGDVNGTATFCINNWRNNDQHTEGGWNAGEIGRALVHEWAHQCGWACGGNAIPGSGHHPCIKPYPY